MLPLEHREFRPLTSNGARLAAAVACGVAALIFALTLAATLTVPLSAIVVIVGAAIAGAAAGLVIPDRQAARASIDAFPRPLRASVAETELEPEAALEPAQVEHVPFEHLGASLEPTGEPSEAFARLAQAVRDVAPSVRVIEVTSPMAGEGKTTVAANLAASLAAGGERVLLIDAHASRHRAHLLLGASPAVAPSEGPYDAWIETTGVRDVELLAVAAANGMLGGIVEDLAGRYDWTLVDTEGGLARERAAPAARADLHVLVARADHTPARLVDIARSRLAGDPTIVVMNAAPGHAPADASEQSTDL